MTAMAVRPHRSGRLTRRLRSFSLAERLLPSSLLNFFAGLCAGAGINLLTAPATGPTDVSAHRIVVDAAAWVVAAALCASAAHVAEGADRKAAAILRTVSTLGEEEQHAVLRDQAAKVAGKFWGLIALTVVALVLAVALIPRLHL